MVWLVRSRHAGIAADAQRLLFSGRELQDGAALRAYGVVRDSTLHLVLRLHGGVAFSLYVKQFDGKTLRVEAGPATSVRELKAMIEREAGEARLASIDHKWLQ